MKEKYELLDTKDKNYIIKIFNEKYDLKLQGFKWEKIGNNNLKLLSEIEFKKLIKLNLDSNDISDIDVLEKFQFEELELLSLNNNNTSNV